MPRRRKVTIITGARMVGKTYLMFQTMKKLMESDVDENNIFYVNFEDVNTIHSIGIHEYGFS